MKQNNSSILPKAHCDLKMAERCLRLALAADSNHAESLVNLGILKMQENRVDEARHLFHSATQILFIIKNLGI